MLNFKWNAVATIFMALITLATSAFAATTELDFSAWDSVALSQDGGTQTFTDICGDLDVTVTAYGEFDTESYFLTTLAGGTNAISTSHEPGTASNSHGYTFDFSESVDLIVETLSLDNLEEYIITSGTIGAYSNLEGAMPSITNTPGQSQMVGVGSGPDLVTGASDGQTAVNGSSISVTYNGQPGNFAKYGSFRLLKSVPEPNSAALLAIGILALLRRRR